LNWFHWRYASVSQLAARRLAGNRAHHARDGVRLVEVVGGPAGLDAWTSRGVVGGLAWMADSSWRRRAEKASIDGSIEPVPGVL
jgi:hypothetical protein